MAGWLARIRGTVAPRRHNARTIAALTANPGCHRRALLDCAGVDKAGLARRIDFPSPFGQSQFAITRGNAFEARVKADGGAELRRLLWELLPATADAAAQDADPGSRAGDGHWLPVPAPADGTGSGNAERYARTCTLLAAAAAGDGGGALFIDHPVLRLNVAGQWVYLEPDVVAARIAGRFHVVEIKSFAVIDGQADPGKVSAAAIQAAVYVLALRDLLADAGQDPRLVSSDAVLVCPRDFGNEPTAALIDVRRQLLVLRRQLARMARIDELRPGLPADLTFDLAPDATGAATRPAAELTEALRAVAARYAPQCLSVCELARFCRHEARGTTAVLGRPVQEELGGVERIETVLALAAGADPSDGARAGVVSARAGIVPDGAGVASDEESNLGVTDSADSGLAEVAARIRDAARLRAEILAGTDR